MKFRLKEFNKRQKKIIYNVNDDEGNSIGLLYLDEVTNKKPTRIILK